MNIPEGYLNGEIRDGFYVESTMKKAWAAEIEVLNEVDRICRQHDIQYLLIWGTFALGLSGIKDSFRGMMIWI